MALPKLESFTAANGTALQTYDANWAINSGAFAINTNAVYSNSASVESGARWNGDTFNADHYAQIVVVAVGADIFIGAGVRHQAGGTGSYYAYYADNNERYFGKVVSNVFTQYGHAASGVSAGNTLRLEASGTTLTPYLNGAVDTAGVGGAHTDSSFATGAAGISGWTSATGQTGERGDSWEGGNLSATATSLPPRKASLWQQHLVVR